MAEVAEQASSVDRLLDPVEIVDDMREKMMYAELRLAQAERSWEKTKVTYSDYTAHPLYDCKSVMERDEERLLAADRQLGEARAQLAWRRQIYTRYRTFFQLSERRVLDRPTDRVLRAFQQRAFRRVLAPPPIPKSGSPCGQECVRGTFGTIMLERMVYVSRVGCFIKTSCKVCKPKMRFCAVCTAATFLRKLMESMQR